MTEPRSDDDNTDIIWSDDADDLEPEQLDGFFVGWPNPPNTETHLRLLRGSSHVVMALVRRPAARPRVVGFATAVSDGVLAAYVPLLEVLPEWQGRGLGRALMQRMLERLRSLYMIDLLCDPPLQVFYEPLGMTRATGMLLRNYDRQSGQRRP